jgi:acyl-CoA hydrolase/RimJ/RimL family protein N-acetyltransferase
MTSGLRSDRMVSPETAVRSIRSGERVFVGTGCGEPRGLVRALEALHPGPDDIELVSVFPTGRFDSMKMSARRHHNRVFVGGGGHDAAGVAMIDYVAIGLDEVPALLTQGRLRVDVAMVQISVPDAHGYASLGISVDLAPAALRAAKRIIAEVNQAMPRTHGDSLIHLDRIDVLTETEYPLGEFAHPPGKEIAVNIAAYVAAIIEDGSTLQIGMGAVPDQVLRLLGDRRHLSIHTDLLTDGVIDLIQSGAVTGRRKDLFRERIVASYCLGTQRLYDFVDDNPLFCFLPIEQVCAPETLARIGRLVSLTQAEAIDLAGQVCVNYPGSTGAGPSTQVAFLRAAARSPGGKPIICLPTTDADGASRIRPALEGDVVGIAREDVHYVVTEFGIAYLFGRSLRERALALIGVAHPNHRAALLEAAKSRGFVSSGQTLTSMGDYAVQAERQVPLKNGVSVLLRPARPTDAPALRALFHLLTADDVYMRFSQRMRNLSDANVQSLCNVNDDTDVAYVATIGPREQETVIGSGCYFLNPATGLAEVAFVVVPDWQGTGLGGALQQRLREHAMGRGVLGFIAEILPRNARMLRLAQSAVGRTEVTNDEDGVIVTTWFSK